MTIINKDYGAADPAMPLPLGGAPQPLQVGGAVLALQLPFGPDPGSITGASAPFRS